MNARKLISRCLHRGVLPFLPARRWLAFRLWLHLHFEDAEPELVHLAKLVPRRGVAIDAGANIGLFALALTQYCHKVYAFEISEQTSRSLKRCAHPKIEIINVGLSNRAREATLYTPVQANGSTLDGWASLAAGNCPGINRHREQSVHLKSLDAFGISECVFLKIDVEGHEVELLEGAAETIRRTRPVILMEVRERNRTRVNLLLEPLGYCRTSLHAMTGVPGGCENFIFVPSELKLWASACRAR
jgi:FkbM family methyltransferase